MMRLSFIRHERLLASGIHLAASVAAGGLNRYEATEGRLAVQQNRASDAICPGVGAGAECGRRPAAVRRAAPAKRSRLTVRLRGAMVGSVCLGMLAVASWLRPLPSGWGTHEQLGLPACSWIAEKGWPCPTCGLTTSLAAAADGDFIAAFRAQPFGLVVFLVAAALAATALAEVATGHDLLGMVRPRWWWALVAVGALLGGWCTKLLMGVAAGTLPVR